MGAISNPHHILSLGITLVSWKVVSEQICDLIKDENGITIDPSDLKYQRGEELKVLLFGFDFTSIDVDYLDEVR